MARKQSGKIVDVILSSEELRNTLMKEMANSVEEELSTVFRTSQTSNSNSQGQPTVVVGESSQLHWQGTYPAFQMRRNHSSWFAKRYRVVFWFSVYLTLNCYAKLFGKSGYPTTLFRIEMYLCQKLKLPGRNFC